jgi:hypothetical protein
VKRAFQTASWLTLAAALLFYVWQNRFAAAGGQIALPKALWLGATVLFWLLLPPVVLCAKQVSGRLKTAYLVFWLPMLARALAEVFLMYGCGCWQYAYGIAHDLASIAVLLSATWLCRRETPRLLAANLAVMAAMFAAEAYFAAYIAAFHRHHPHAQVWFVGWESPHLANQAATAAIVAALAFWLVHLTRKLP